MADTAIEWTDVVWNPTTGCDRVSPGCDNCYALTLAKRLKGMGSAKYQTDGDPRTSGPGFGLAMHEDVLGLPLSWRKPRRVFVNSMSDLFHPRVTDDFIARVFAVMATAGRHAFQVLTKRPPRTAALLTRHDFLEAIAEHASDLIGSKAWQRWQLDLGDGWMATPAGPVERFGIFEGRNTLWSPPWPLPNVWLGVSVENQEQADARIPRLLQTPAVVRWLSCEPLLGPIDLGIDDPHRGHESDDVNGYPNPRICLTCSTDDDEMVEYFRREPGGCGIDWVVTGGESGPRHRHADPDWFRSIRDQCDAAGVAYLHKQNGGRYPKANGRRLDGVTHDGYPEVRRAA